ncbi:dirigent protein 22-like [Henckelia pumila]|uniref:dirigent protein 22-like n=1 Tax=Henckelia pumila TaxID=405737 RepID=UPI003C6DD845
MAKFKVGITFVLSTYFHAMQQVLLCQGLQPVDRWFEALQGPLVWRLQPKFVTIEFYTQDVLAGNGETSYEIARSNIIWSPSTSFSELKMEDNLLTKGPDINSPAVGRRQGLIGFADLNQIAMYMSFNFIFNEGLEEGLYNGSTISVMGRRPLSNSLQELSIVGGTGVFRLAQGIAVCNTYQSNTAGDTIIKYTLYVKYF